MTRMCRFELSVVYDREHFERYGAVSVPRHSMHWWANRFYLRLLRRAAATGRVLEIGCGTGFLLKELAKRFDTYGIDISPFALEHARRNCPQARLLSLRAENLDSLPQGYFDAVIAKHVFEHFPSPQLVLEKCSRVLRPGGVLLYTVPNLDCVARRWKGPRWYGSQDTTHVSLLPAKEWVDLTQGSGFRVERAFSDGLWDVPYVPLLPNALQKLLFGSLGGIQALAGGTFLPIPLGEALIVLARNGRDRADT